MSASDAREQLEAVIWRLADPAATAAMMAAALSAADAYATAVAADVAEQKIAAILADPETLAGRQRLAEAAAEASGRPA